MFNANGLPYSPSLYFRRVSTVSTGVNQAELVNADNSRVYLLLTNDAGAFLPGATFWFGQVGNGGTSMSGNGISKIDFTWDWHNILVCQSVSITGFPAGLTWNITEILYNPYPSGVTSYATRKLESLTAKIKRYYAK
jgi:hypothetical protein